MHRFTRAALFVLTAVLSCIAIPTFAAAAPPTAAVERSIAPDSLAVHVVAATVATVGADIASLITQGTEMPNATQKSTKTTAPGSDERNAVVQVNALIAAVRAICVSLDADSGVTITTLTATFDAAVSKVGDQSGTAITTL